MDTRQSELIGQFGLMAVTKFDEPTADELLREHKAAEHLKKRPEFISAIEVDDRIAEEQRNNLLKKATTNSFTLREYIKPGSVDWEPHFEFINAFNINSRNTQSTQPPRLINLYHEKSCGLSTRENFAHYYCYSNGISSSANISISLISSKPYQRNLTGFFFINSIDSFPEDGYKKYRYGSFLIQTAIEHSLRHGLDGRIQLVSSKNSGQFYFKLGFLPRKNRIYAALAKGEDIDGRKMYLSGAALEIWKEKISKQPILLSEEEIKLYCQPSRVIDERAESASTCKN